MFELTDVGDVKEVLADMSVGEALCSIERGLAEIETRLDLGDVFTDIEQETLARLLLIFEQVRKDDIVESLQAGTSAHALVCKWRVLPQRISIIAGGSL